MPHCYECGSATPTLIQRKVKYQGRHTRYHKEGLCPECARMRDRQMILKIIVILAVILLLYVGSLLVV